MKDLKVTLKMFCDSIQSAIGSDTELEEDFKSWFELGDGGEVCQSKK